MTKHKETTMNEKNNVSGIVCKGTVIEALPNAFFKIKLENESIVLAHISGKMRTKHIRVLPDDVVDVEVSIYDLTRGRIVYRYK